jgi:hypothetical protein
VEPLSDELNAIKSDLTSAQTDLQSTIADVPAPPVDEPTTDEPPTDEEGGGTNAARRGNRR